MIKLTFGRSLRVISLPLVGAMALSGVVHAANAKATSRALLPFDGQSQQDTPFEGKLSRELHERDLSKSSFLGPISVSLAIVPKTNHALLHPLVIAEPRNGDSPIVSGSIVAWLGRGTLAAMGFSQTGTQIARQLETGPENIFLIAPHADDTNGFDIKSISSFGARREIGNWGITVTGEGGNAIIYDPQAVNAQRFGWDEYDYNAGSIGVDRKFGALKVSARLSDVMEDQTVLGAHFGPMEARYGSQTWLMDVGMQYAVSPRLRVDLTVRQGWTLADQGGAISGGTIRTRAWSFDIDRRELFDAQDGLAIRIAQPLRVENRAVQIAPGLGNNSFVPNASTTPGLLNLKPTGREIDVETAYRHRLKSGIVSANVYFRTSPGNLADQPTDIGAALKFTRGF